MKRFIYPVALVLLTASLLVAAESMESAADPVKWDIVAEELEICDGNGECFTYYAHKTTAPDPVPQLVADGELKLDMYCGPMKIMVYAETVVLCDRGPNSMALSEDGTLRVVKTNFLGDYPPIFCEDEIERSYFVEPGFYVQLGTCDDDADCTKEMEKMCSKAGHGDVIEDMSHDGSMCSASCADGSGAKAYVFCDPASTDTE